MCYLTLTLVPNFLRLLMGRSILYAWMSVLLCCCYINAYGQLSLPATDTLGKLPSTRPLRHTALVPNTFRVIDSARGIVAYRYFTHPIAPQIAETQLLRLRDSAANVRTLSDDFSIEMPKQDSLQLMGDSRLRKSGSLTRGLTVGNAGGSSVTSGLRLQIEGDLGDGLTIVGNLTDENLPIQPDGTTQQINDFDKIFFRLSKGKHTATLGDFDIRNGGTFFGDFYRNVQGIRVQYQSNAPTAIAGKAQPTALQYSLAAAVAKGKFHTNTLAPKEGVRGPYRLVGKNNELFFIVLANSEKVYLNGNLLIRGESEDYIINYNTAEITFTAKNLITATTRIVVDFEYNDRYYNRSLMVGQMNQTWKIGSVGLQARASYARDADNANAPFDNAEAYKLARPTLAKLGDAATATTTGVSNVGWDEGATRYLRRDTVVQNDTLERYIFSQNKELAIYQIQFSFVGDKKGYYIRDNTGINGNVYTWVAPAADGSPRGNYAPVRTWVLPRLLQVTNVGISARLTPRIRAYTEISRSNEDKNRLSSLNDDDNMAWANRIGAAMDTLRLMDSLRLTTEIYYQYIGKKYSNLDRVYRAEYARQWDIGANSPRRDERIAAAKITLHIGKSSLTAETALRNTGVGKHDFRQTLNYTGNNAKRIAGALLLTYIRTQDDSSRRISRWLRSEGDLYHAIGKRMKVGSKIWMEDKREFFADTLAGGSLLFADITPYISWKNNRKVEVEASVNMRGEQAYAIGKMRDKLQAATYQFRMNYRPLPTVSLQTTTNFRDFRLLDTAFRAEGLASAQVLATNIQANIASKNRLLTTTMVYDVASEQLAKRQIGFQKVPAGQGQYVWQDINADSVVQINELFPPTLPNTADYIRISAPTQQLYPATKTMFNANAIFDFKYLKDSPRFLRRSLRVVRLLSNVRMEQSRTQGATFQSYTPVIRNIFNDTSLLSAVVAFRQEMTFFQNNPKGDAKLFYQQNSGKQFLSTGEEWNRAATYGTSQRVNIGRKRSIEATALLLNKRQYAAQFANRRYDIRAFELAPKGNIQFNNNARLTIGYEYKNRANTSDSTGQVNAHVQSHSGFVESTINIKGRNVIRPRIEIARIAQQGAANYAAEFELRNGLQKGTNVLWTLSSNVYVMENLLLTISYDGRFSAVAPLSHTARMQLQAFF